MYDNNAAYSPHAYFIFLLLLALLIPPDPHPIGTNSNQAHIRMLLFINYIICFVFKISFFPFVFIQESEIPTKGRIIKMISMY